MVHLPAGRGFVRALPAVAVAWAVLIVAAPFVASAPVPGGAYVSASAYWLGALVCHQRPDRSFHLSGAQLPVCARCTGLYLSAALAIIVVWARRRSTRAPGAARWRSTLACAALPTIATLVAEWWHPGLTSGLVRSVAAVPLGAAAGVLLAETAGFRGRLRGCERTRQSA